MLQQLSHKKMSDGYLCPGGNGAEIKKKPWHLQQTGTIIKPHTSPISTLT